MMPVRICGVLAAIALSTAVSVPASAAPVGIFGTGDSLSDGDSDPNWGYSYPTAGPTIIAGQAVVLTFPNHHYLPGFSGSTGNWVANSAQAKWVSTTDSDCTLAGSPCFIDADTLVTYSTEFDLTGFRLDTVTIAINWTGDDDIERVLLNGVVVASYPDLCDEQIGEVVGCVWGVLHAVSIASGFVSGRNTLEFETRNDDNFKEGIIVQASGVGDLLSDPGTPVPAPATLPLLAAGLIALRVVRRRA